MPTSMLNIHDNRVVLPFLARGLPRPRSGYQTNVVVQCSLSCRHKVYAVNENECVLILGRSLKQLSDENPVAYSFNGVWYTVLSRSITPQSEAMMKLSSVKAIPQSLSISTLLFYPGESFRENNAGLNQSIAVSSAMHLFY